MRFVTLLVLLIVVVCVMETPAAPSTTNEWIEGARGKIKELQNEVEAAQLQAEAALSANQDIQAQLSTVETQVQTISKERDQWVKYGNDQHDKYMEADKKIASEKAALLRRDLIITFLTLALGVYAFLKFYLRIPFL